MQRYRNATCIASFAPSTCHCFDDAHGVGRLRGWNRPFVQLNWMPISDCIDVGFFPIELSIFFIQYDKPICRLDVAAHLVQRQTTIVQSDFIDLPDELSVDRRWIDLAD
ncbi:hypothetical protein SAMN06265222_12536 [Neorhodopirellula lusitana]|uniref:Uncharacterized protein n=1 Tax=Neorhodopirellula lusitana TaxID=445327 RepID=A0ABY1QQS6_9BACT|nr:hypothetical protein SAMN06265222_12536 [Neorhodopirellula lusitana]